MKLTTIAFSLFVTVFIGLSVFVFKPSQSTSTTTPVSSTPTSIATTNNSQCIITVDGQRYDVTVFKNQHSGGNVFSCSTDMSNVFHNQHSQRYLQMMQPYKI
jgi:cytochrome b involved in lipid metabolism